MERENIDMDEKYKRKIGFATIRMPGRRNDFWRDNQNVMMGKLKLTKLTGAGMAVPEEHKDTPARQEEKNVFGFNTAQASSILKNTWEEKAPSKDSIMSSLQKFDMLDKQR